MSRYIAKRLLMLIPTLLGISIIVFLVMRLIPGDTISAMIGTQFKLTEVQAEALRAYYGLDQPLYIQYWRWLVAALQGDFGLSVRTAEPVLSEILGRFPLTLELALLAMIFALVVGIPIGILSAVKRESLFDISGRVFALVGLAVPTFWSGTIIIFVLSVVFHLAPNSGNYVSLIEDPAENLKQLIFPAMVLGLAFSASVMRTTRSSLLEEIHKEYARTAIAKGCTQREMVMRHSLRNALIPIITLVGFEAGYLLGGAIIVEEVFAIPGIGRLLVNAINQRDYALIQGTIIFIAFNFVLVNLLADLMYGLANPRIRYD